MSPPGFRPGIICGAVMAWRAKNDTGTGLPAVCHRPPHPGRHHLSAAAMQHARDRRASLRRLARRMTDPADTVAA